MRNEIFGTMKHMQWQVAKGHLLAFLSTYQGQPRVDDRYDDRNHQDYERMHKLVHDFTAAVDGALELENP